MNHKPKIFVFHLKEVIYTGVFILLGILFLLLLYLMFKPHSKPSDNPDSQTLQSTQSGVLYEPGIYTTVVDLGGRTFEVRVQADNTQIKEISLHRVDQILSTRYPLLQDSMASLSKQICETQSLEHLNIPQEISYTSKLLLDAIHHSLEMAKISNP